MDDRATTKRPPMPTFGNMLNTIELQRGLRKAAQSIKTAKDAFAKGMKVEIDESREVQDRPKPRTHKLAQCPRLPKELPLRRKILAKKLREAGAKSPMHLALMRAA